MLSTFKFASPSIRGQASIDLFTSIIFSGQRIRNAAVRMTTDVGEPGDLAKTTPSPLDVDPAPLVLALPLIFPTKASVVFPRLLLSGWIQKEND
jgi:hypothetical protein